MLYNEPLYRPPSEANSAIVQVTLGCSWNQCLFCDMYHEKRFRLVPLQEIENDLRTLSEYMPEARKLFLADGDAFVLSYDKLRPILELAHSYFPALHRISAYALPRDIASKSPEELEALRSLGLSLLYVGVETGSDYLLETIRKSETRTSIVEGISRAHAAGIDTSVMIISGLGGKEHSEEHAKESASLLNLIQPKYLSTLTLFLPRGLANYQQAFGGNFTPLDTYDVLQELRLFISGLELEGTIFRSNHVSNSLPLEGILSRDRAKLLATIDRMSLEAERLRRFTPEYGY